MTPLPEMALRQPHPRLPDALLRVKARVLAGARTEDVTVVAMVYGCRQDAAAVQLARFDGDLDRCLDHFVTAQVDDTRRQAAHLVIAAAQATMAVLRDV